MKILITLLLSVFTLLVSGADKKNVRIVSLSPNMTEIIFALDNGKSLVGRSNVCNYPEKVKKLPVAGLFGRPDVERVIALKPDYLILAALQDKAVIKHFEQLNIKVLFLPAKSFEDYFKTLKKLGEILGCPEKAELICKKSRAELKKFREGAEKIKAADKIKVLFVIQDTPLFTIGRDSFINNMINLAGGKSITAETPKAYFKCSLEWVVTHQPDLLLLPAMPENKVKELATRPGWKYLKAVKNGNLFYKMNPDLLSRMGPRSIEGIKLLKKIFSSVKKSNSHDDAVK